MKLRFFHVFALFSVLLFAAACGGDTPSPSPHGDSDGDSRVDSDTGEDPGDTGASEADSADDVTDGDGEADVADGEGDSDVSEGTSTPPETVDGVILCDPQGNDCPDGPCVTFDPSFDQGLCGTFCVTDADCPSTFRCVRITVGADVETACLPIDFCLDRDGDGYGFGPGCDGPDCNDNDPDVYFGAPSLCDGKDNNCNGLIDDNPIGTAEDCDTGFPGICAEGRQQCSFGTWECSPRRQPAEFETCNGLDTTCDGLVDAVLDDEGNEVPLSRQCYEGPSGTDGVGQCRQGTRTCTDGEFGACEGQVLPSPVELCDGVDNTCNGVVDDSPVGVGTPCDTGLQGLCGEGVNQCVNGEVVCVQLYQPAAEETCNGLDTTCDGLVDATLDEDGNEVPLSRRCYDGPIGTEGVGRCRAGVRVCVDGQFGACDGQVLPAPAEICDGLDSTCNGLVDDEPVDVGQDCDTGQIGLCGVGRWECQAGARVCAAINRPADVESCSGQDDTCDGLVDQVLDEDGNAVALTESCYSGPAGTQGVGICMAGVRTCSDGEWSSCAGEVLPREETCNGLDDNCDGLTDNANSAGARLSEQCYEGPEDTQDVGECRGGTRFCVDGEFGECVGQVLPAPVEVCDGRDNTCDGLVDQTEPGSPLTRSCYDGPSGTLGEGVCTGGTQTCSSGEFGACVGQVLPGTELCNGLDDNCNGTVDSGNPGGGIPCNSGLPGVCAAGVTACVSGSIECEATIQPGEQTERCNGIDENCDGTVDSGFTGLGQPCFVGDGICRRSGLNICNPGDDTAQPICDATPGTAETEVCNYLDSNCDGMIDTGFRNAQGIYDTVEHCGACDLDCNNLWPGGPELFNVVPRCGASGGVASCTFDCADGYVDADGVAENGCELLPDDGAIYVSRPANGGSNATGCGTWDSPCATITFGIQRAQAASRERVRVSDGVFRERVTLPNGISLLGGHNSTNWTRNPDVFVTLISGTGGENNDRIAVRLENITSATELSGLTIQSENALPGGNSIGVYIRNANQNLRVENNQIFAGRGGDGTAGQAGSPGENATDGGNGNLRTTGPNCNATRPAPGSGGSRTCPNLRSGGNVTVSGGRGGDSATCPASGQRAGSGLDGGGPDGGTGGLGPGHFIGTNNGCTVNADLGVDPVAGTSGSRGGDGTRGTRSTNANGTVSGGMWRGAGGGDGQAGLPGSGGGGGSAAAGVSAEDNSTPRYYFGSTGGGGGSGGCGGDRGRGGSAGGGSFAVFISQNGATAAGSMPVITDNTMNRGAGGNGGSGGNGGGGGDSSLGGTGGPAGAGLGNRFDFCMFAGGDGGTGGRGGHGGGGAGGNGGASWDIFVHNGTPRAAYTSANTFTIDGSTDTGGAGGAGGNSSNTALGTGEAGLGGPSGNLLGL